MEESADCRTVFTDKSSGDSRLTTIVGRLLVPALFPLFPLEWFVEGSAGLPELLGIFKPPPLDALEPPRRVKLKLLPGLLLLDRT